MPVIIVGTEKTLAALRPRLVAGKVTPNQAKALDEAIRTANPDTDFAKLQPGTVVTVPGDAPKVALPGDVSLDPGSLHALTGLTEVAGSQLDELVGTAKRLDKTATADRRALAKTLAADALDAAGRKDPAVNAALNAARAAVEAEDAAAKDRAAALAEAQSAWSAELGALAKLLPSK
jgi:hypothetical protein